MSIGICFDNDYSQALTEASLNDRISRLEDVIRRIYHKNIETADLYLKTAQHSLAYTGGLDFMKKVDAVEFSSKSAGLIEANLNIRQCLVEAGLSDILKGETK